MMVVVAELFEVVDDENRLPSLGHSHRFCDDLAL
jgi:hypothetical protein